MTGVYNAPVTQAAGQASQWAAWMDRAVALAIRGHGGAEPNPLVGCIIVDAQGRECGQGWHARFGGPHAEVMALHQAGARARGGTAVVTLEPCAHVGKTPPCTEALAAAGIVRVVYGAEDPHPQAAGGAARLRAHGIEAIHAPTAASADLARPFVHRIRTGRPWVVAKWAQSLDGRIASSAGESRWISSPQSRTMVHRERGRVDAILTGIGTVLADDPLLTARHGHVRRLARRVVWDPDLAIPLDSALLGSLSTAPLTIAYERDGLQGPSVRARELASRGVELVKVREGAAGLRTLLEHLSSRHAASTVLVEAGGGLVGRLLQADLVDEAWVFIAPFLVGDREAPGPAVGLPPRAPSDVSRWRLVDVRQRGADLTCRYRPR